MWGFPGGTMELGESVTETLKREIAEETGLTVEVGKIIGIYSKYSDRYPNGDQSQPIVIFFECIVTGGELKRDGQEILDLKFFNKNNKPPLFNSQHEDMFHDLFDKSRTDCVIR